MTIADRTNAYVRSSTAKEGVTQVDATSSSTAPGQAFRVASRVGLHCRVFLLRGATLHLEQELRQLGFLDGDGQKVWLTEPGMREALRRFGVR